KIFAEVTVSDKGVTRRCGDVAMSAEVHCTDTSKSRDKRQYRVHGGGLQVNVHADTAVTIVDITNHLQDRIREIDLSRERGYLRRIQRGRRQSIMARHDRADTGGEDTVVTSGIFTSAFSLELHQIQIVWIVGTSAKGFNRHETEDLVFSIKAIDLSTKSEDSARLTITDLQLQMVPVSVSEKTVRSFNSALLPEMVFNVSYASSKLDRKLTFQAA
ncbi:hypothetical protein LTS18_002307, partial [Coniosporium uncinatum]